MANERQELVTKISALVTAKFGGDYVACFNYYDADHNSKIDSNELYNALYDADIGNYFTRNAWVKGIIAALDTDRDGLLSFEEFQHAVMA